MPYRTWRGNIFIGFWTWKDVEGHGTTLAFNQLGWRSYFWSKYLQREAEYYATQGSSHSPGSTELRPATGCHFRHKLDHGIARVFLHAGPWKMRVSH
jgi:hypothetical protein